jgi:hypothetical protein
MQRVGGEDTGVPSSIRKVVVSSFIGTTIEWYDEEEPEERVLLAEQQG